MSDTLTTNPPSIVFGSLEAWAPAVDVSALLTGGQTPTSPVVTIVQVSSSKTPVSLDAEPSVNGNLIEQQIQVGALKAGQTYRMTVSFTPSDTTDVYMAVVQISVPL